MVPTVTDFIYFYTVYLTSLWQRAIMLPNGVSPLVRQIFKISTRNDAQLTRENSTNNNNFIWIKQSISMVWRQAQNS